MIYWEDFTLQKTANIDSPIRLQGYYYAITDEGYEPAGVFYQNGVFLESTGGKHKNFEEMDTYIQNAFINSKRYMTDRMNWGLYTIQDSIIRIEKFFHVSAFERCSSMLMGNIINDTTFIVHYLSIPYKKEVRKFENNYKYFRAFTPKPDSTQAFF